ncbi:MAG: ATP-binding protein [Vulcanimicrobiota bacterium]
MEQKLNNQNITASLQKSELLALFEIGKAVNSTLDLDKVLDIILRETLSLFEAEAGSVMMANEKGFLKIRVARGLPEEIVKKTVVKPGEGIAGWVFETGQILQLDGKVKDPRFKKVVDRKDSIYSSLAVPLRSRGKMIGVLMLRRSNPIAYDEGDKYLVSLIADHVGMAIENAAQYELQLQKSRELQQLNEDIRREKLKIETILSSMADGVIVTDPYGSIVLINKAGCKMLQKPEMDLLMKHFNSLFPGQCQFDEIYKAVYDQNIRFKKDVILTFDGEEMYFSIIANGMGWGDERHEGIVVVIHNITEMKRIDKMKTEFVSMVSHELRTPLTSIEGFTELMLSRDYEKSRRDRYLNIILKDSRRLTRLIDNLLDISKLESGQIEVNLEPVKLEDLIPDILTIFEGQVEKHEIVYNNKSELPIILIDRDLFTNVLTNLVSNAIKYSPEGGEIVVCSESDEQFIIVSVKDQGVGLSAESCVKVFEKFYRVDNSLTRETGGTGLGLATVKYIIEGFGGKIWVESELGKGSNFKFTLPLEDSQRR